MTKKIKISFAVHEELKQRLPTIARFLSTRSTGVELGELSVLDAEHLPRKYMDHDNYRDKVLNQVGVDADLPFVKARAFNKQDKEDGCNGFGVTIYQCNGTKVNYAFVCFAEPTWGEPVSFYVLLKEHEKAFYEHVRQQDAKSNSSYPPILEDGMLEDIVLNTLGFLHKKTQFEKYGVRVVRGIMLKGPPGNGKGMVCKWIKKLCIDDGIEWGRITGSQIAGAYNDGSDLYDLFRRFTVTFFDDMDLSLMDRSASVGAESCDLFAAMDGIEDNKHRVRIFTTNEDIKELDAAFLRPNRIDKIYHLDNPEKSLRKRLVNQVWPAEIKKYLNQPGVMLSFLNKSEGYSFAELESIRTHMVRNMVQGTGEWDKDKAFEEVDAIRLQKSSKQRTAGFGNHSK